MTTDSSTGLDNPPPRVTVRLGDDPRWPLLTRQTWHLEDAVTEFLALLPVTSRGQATSGTLRVLGEFAGSAPALELAPSDVQRLADAGIDLEIEVTPLDLGLVRRGLHARDAKTIDTTVALSFRVRGDFDPDAFTRRIGITPTHVGRTAGNQRIPITRLRTWRLQRGPFSATALTSKEITALLSTLSKKSEAIREAAREMNLRTAYRIAAVYVDSPPHMRLDRAELRAIAQLACHLEYSISVPRESSDFVEF